MHGAGDAPVHQSQRFGQFGMVADAGKCGISGGQEQVAATQRRVLSELVPYGRDAATVKIAVLQIVMDE